MGTGWGGKFTVSYTKLLISCLFIPLMEPFESPFVLVCCGNFELILWHCVYIIYGNKKRKKKDFHNTLSNKLLFSVAEGYLIEVQAFTLLAGAPISCF